MKKNNILMICILVLTFLVVVVGSSFAFYTFYQSGKKGNVLHTGGLNIVFDDSTSISISNDNAYPVTDEVGRNTNPYSFNLTSSNSLDVGYEISIINDQEAIDKDGCSDKLLEYSKIKVQLQKNGVVITEGILGYYMDNIIDSGTIGSDEVNSYELRLWIDSTAGSEVMGKHFHGKIQLKVMDLVETS